MRSEGAGKSGRAEKSQRSESKSEGKSREAKQASSEAGQAAKEAGQSAREAKEAAAQARQAGTEPGRREATGRAEQAAAQAEEKSRKAAEAARRAQAAAQEAERGAGKADKPAVEQARGAASAAAASAKSAAGSAAQAREEVRTLRGPGKADTFSTQGAGGAAGTAGSSAAGGATRAAAANTRLTAEESRAVEAAKAAQADAKAATESAVKADQRVQAGVDRLKQAQQAVTTAQAAYDNFQPGPRTGQIKQQLKEDLDAAKAELAAAQQELRSAQADAAKARTQAEAAARKADSAADKLEQLAKANPQSREALSSVAADTRRAESQAKGAMAIAGRAAAPQAIATVSYDKMTDVRNNAGLHDSVLDGAIVGRNGQVYPPGTDASQVQGMLPDNGRPPTGERIYYVNGIQNNAAYQSGSMQAIANATGAEVVGIHNSTEGMGKDLLQCAMDKVPAFREANAATQSLANQILKDVEAGRPVHLMAHSQGGLVTSNALKIVKDYLVQEKGARGADDILKNIKVESFGAAADNWPHGPQYVHYINDKDTVPMQVAMGALPPEVIRESAGGERAQVHFIRDDPRSAHPLAQNSATQMVAAGGDIPAHDFNDGYLHHRLPFEEGLANSNDLSGASPVATRDENGNLRGYTYYQVQQ